MAAVLQEEQIWTLTWTEGRHCEDTEKTGPSRNMGEKSEPIASQGPTEQSTCLHLDLRLPASGTLRKCVVLC